MSSSYDSFALRRMVGDIRKRHERIRAINDRRGYFYGTIKRTRSFECRKHSRKSMCVRTKVYTACKSFMRISSGDIETLISRRVPSRRAKFPFYPVSHLSLERYTRIYTICNKSHSYIALPFSCSIYSASSLSFSLSCCVSEMRHMTVPYTHKMTMLHANIRAQLISSLVYYVMSLYVLEFYYVRRSASLSGLSYFLLRETNKVVCVCVIRVYARNFIYLDHCARVIRIIKIHTSLSLSITLRDDIALQEELFDNYSQKGFSQLKVVI